MPFPAWLELEGIEGGGLEQAEEGRETWSRVLGFEHGAELPVRPGTSDPMGKLVHGSVTVRKDFDKATPLIWQYSAMGTVVPTVKIHWFWINGDTGSEEEYFTHELTTVRIVGVRNEMQHCYDEQKKNYRHEEVVQFRFVKLKWTWIPDGIEYEFNFEKPTA